MTHLCATRILLQALLGGILLGILPASAPPSADVQGEDLIITFSGNVGGEVEICHCSRAMNGGFPRRADYLSQLREGSVPVLAVDLGNVFKSTSPQGRLKAEICFKAYGLMKYDAIVIAENDLILGPKFLLDAAAAHGITLISATVVRPNSKDPIVAPYVVRTVGCGGRKIRFGVLGMVGKPPRSSRLPKVYSSNGLDLIPVTEAAAKYMPELRDQADVVVIAGQLTRQEIDALAKAYPDLAMIVSGRQPMRSEAPITQSAGVPVYYSAGDLSQSTIRAGVQLDSMGKVASVSIAERVLDSDFGTGPQMADLLKEYTSMLASLPPPSVGGGRSSKGMFVGAEKCGECHAEALDIWKKSAHAGAIETLARTSQTKDHDCLPCHTTGYLAPTGFRDVDLTPQMVNVQCEACHGPGSSHIEKASKKYGTVGPKTCMNCHTSEKDVDWNYERCWARIKHQPLPQR